MKYELDEMFYMNDLIRGLDLRFCNSWEYEFDTDWFSNYQLLKLFIELKAFFEENNIDYQPDMLSLFERYKKEVRPGECYEYVSFADYVLYSVFSDLKHLSIRFCIDSIDELRDMYEQYSVFPYLEGIGVDVYQDFYTLYFSPDGYSWDNIEGCEETYEEWCVEYLALDENEIEEGVDIYQHLDELIDYCDSETLKAISEGRLTDFLWYEPYQFMQMVNELGIVVYETADVQQLSV